MHLRRRVHRQGAGGFTLIELMIAVAVIVLLVAVAFPTYQGSVRKSRRSEAYNALNQVQQAQERSRGNFSSYCANLTSTPSTTSCGLGIGSTTAGGYYTIAVTSSDATGYIAVATATGSQVADTNCGVLAVKLAGGTISYGSAPVSSSVVWNTNPDPNRCWPK